jgi:hypothetical protein
MYESNISLSSAPPHDTRRNNDTGQNEVDLLGHHITCELTKPNSFCKKKLHIYVVKDDMGLISHCESVEIKNARGEWERARHFSTGIMNRTKPS